MSIHNAQGTDVEEIQYADEFVIDEGGIDLKYAGESVLSASFDHVDNFQLAYEVLPEGFLLPPDVNADKFENGIQNIADSPFSDLDLEANARLFLTALARRKGYEKSSR